MKFDYANPYPSTRIPVFARNVVSTSHPLAAQAGLRMLQKGGNAVDAAIATAAAMTLVEPVSNGLGSDAFCILWDGKKLHGLNASGTSPAAWTPEYFRRKYGADAKAPPQRGMDSVTVPGAVGGWVALSEHFGKLPFADLLEPAIEIAERGYLMPPVVQQKWAAATPSCNRSPASREAFLPWGRAPDGRRAVPLSGRRARAERHRRDQGRGLLPRRDRRGAGEVLQRQRRQPQGAATSPTGSPSGSSRSRKNYRGYTLHEIPPNGQGIAALIALGILEQFDMASMPVDSVADSQHLQIEAMKLAFADTYHYVVGPIDDGGDARCKCSTTPTSPRAPSSST